MVQTQILFLPFFSKSALVSTGVILKVISYEDGIAVKEATVPFIVQPIEYLPLLTDTVENSSMSATVAQI